MENINKLCYICADNIMAERQIDDSVVTQGSKIGIVVCSNAQKKSYKSNIDNLLQVIHRLGYETVCSPYIYEEESYFSASGEKRAQVLMDMYRDDSVRAIFDISGGDIANEILEYLDYDAIGSSDKRFYGYSDLTTVVNAIYAKTGRKSGLYQIRNLIYEDADRQQKYFLGLLNEEFDGLADASESGMNKCSYYFVQGGYMEGTVVGGNIRCLLKLAGTEYMPDFTGKILLLESLNSTSAQVMTYLCQLRQLGAFDRINGILLGTFTRLDSEIFVPSIEELVQLVAGHDIPVARTMDIGHGTDAKCIYIGENVRIRSDIM